MVQRYNLGVERGTLEDSGKYVQWGNAAVDTGTAGLGRGYQDTISHEQNIIGKSRNGQLQQGQRYATEYSQVSAIETGFKKLKSNQIEILRELKRQYQVLRKSSVDSQVVRGRGVSGSESNADSSAKSSRRSGGSGRRQTRQGQVSHLQRKQMQLVVNNSMRKIEQLLQNQIELKKIIFQLKNRAEKQGAAHGQYQVLVGKLKNSEQQQRRQVEEAKRQIQRLRGVIKQLNERIGGLEGGLALKQNQLKKIEQTKRLLEEQVRNQKNKQLILELDLKKSKMEYDMLERSKQQQIEMFLKNQESRGTGDDRQKDRLIRRLQEEIDLKDRRYKLLLQQFQSSKNQQDRDGVQRERRDRERLQEQRRIWEQGHKSWEQALKRILQQKSSSSDLTQSVRLLLNQVTLVQKSPQNRLQEELQKVKGQLEALRIQRMETKSDFKGESIRIRELQRLIEQQNMQKMNFLQDLGKLTSAYTDLKKLKERLAKELGDSRLEIDDLREENRKLRRQSDAIRNVNVDLTESQLQNSSLRTKMQQFNMRQVELANARSDIDKLREGWKSKEEVYEQEVRLLRRKADEEEFRAQKSQQQGEFKLNLAKTEHRHQMNRLQEQLQRVRQANTLLKVEFQQHRVQWEGKLAQKARQSDTNAEKASSKEKDKQKAVQQARLEVQQRLRLERDKHLAEIGTLLEKVDSLASANEKLLAQNLRAAQLQRQAVQLRRVLRQSKKISQGVDHLWQVKEVQYANINQLILDLK